MKKRSVVYIDGFNLYFGSLKGSQNKWLDIQKYFQLLRPDDEIKKIWYFTAKVLYGSTDQETYLKALKTLTLIEIIEGQYKHKNRKCGVADCSFSGSKEYSGREEKRTDVNIALQILDDAYQNECDRIILVSGDSDLVPALKLAKKRFPEKEIVVYIPARDRKRGAARELRNASDRHKTLPLNLLSKAQFPHSLSDGRGGILEKPKNW